jgi:hypothetical protein
VVVFDPVSAYQTNKKTKRSDLLMRKTIIALLVLALVFGFGAATYAAHGDTAQQHVRVIAPYYLNRLAGPGTVVMTFNENDYATGYVQKNAQLKLQVGAPGAFHVYAMGNYGGQGTINALKVRASGHNWKDLDNSATPIYWKSNTGLYEFYVDYRVDADELNPGNADIDKKVVVTYGLL